MKHTPTPWILHSNGKISRFNEDVMVLRATVGLISTCWPIYNTDEEGDSDDYSIAKNNAQANAKHIVKCVNMHDEIIENLQEAANLLKRNGYRVVPFLDVIKKAKAE